MKNLILSKVWILMFGLFACALQAQDQPRKALLHTLLHEVVVKDFDFLNQQVGEENFIIFPNVVFEKVQKITQDGQSFVVIKPVKIIKAKKDDLNNPAMKPIELNTYFLASNIDLEGNLQTYTKRHLEMRVGIANIPVKFYTPRDGRAFDFSSSSVSLGPTLGFSHQISKSKNDFWINYLLSMNFTMVTPRQDDFSTDDFEGNTLSALSPAIGLSLNSNGAEFGIFAGKDYLPGSAAKTWVHNGETWLSVSIGLSFSTLADD